MMPHLLKTLKFGAQNNLNLISYYFLVCKSQIFNLYI